MELTTRRLFSAILFIALFVMATREISDPDFWWHLRTGQYIVETLSIPRVDIFSFTNAGRQWIAHEWLAEVIVYAIFALGSFLLLTLVFSTIITLSFAFTYARSDGKPYVAAFVLLLTSIATAPTWGVRPQMFSLLLTSVFLWVLGGDHKNRPYVWLLPPLMILWVNLHSGYALGIVIVGVYLFGEIVSRLTNHATGSPTPQFPRTLALVFVFCLFAVLLNPNGATMYIYPFETLTSPTMQSYIQEWFSPDFHQIEFQPFAWLLLATLAAIALSGKRASLTQTILLTGFAYAALRSARHIPIFAIIAAPILAEHLWHIIESRGWQNTLKSNTRPPRGLAIVNWILLGVIAFAGIARVAMVGSNQDTIEQTKFPAAAVNFLQAQKISGGLFNAYNWGGYLIWRFYPEQRVFIDGRADVYGDAFIENMYLKAYTGAPDWREPLEHFDVHLVLIEPNAPLATLLARDAGWKKMYGDKQAVVYSR